MTYFVNSAVRVMYEMEPGYCFRAILITNMYMLLTLLLPMLYTHANILWNVYIIHVLTHRQTTSVCMIKAYSFHSVNYRHAS